MHTLERRDGAQARRIIVTGTTRVADGVHGVSERVGGDSSVRDSYMNLVELSEGSTPRDRRTAWAVEGPLQNDSLQNRPYENTGADGV